LRLFRIVWGDVRNRASIARVWYNFYDTYGTALDYVDAEPLPLPAEIAPDPAAPDRCVSTVEVDLDEGLGLGLFKKALIVKEEPKFKVM
jgi:hypothetical protein